jgi:hypothetical protein
MHGCRPRDDELVAYVRRLDLDADARLKYDEFIEGIKPVEPFSKMLLKN